MPQRRDKPLRTYSRRPDPRGEPPSKKRRTSPETTAPAVEPPPHVEEKQEPPAKKGSILSYFKPVVRQPTAAQSPPATEASTEPSSPVRRKRPRTLRIRPVLPPSSEPQDEDESETPDSDVPPARRRLRGAEATTLRKKKAKAAALVQTTLDITAAPSFSECRICDTVWNPLYPDDVKYHSKRHAAVLRKEKRKLDEL
ncbi:hypothetical protein B0I35DRAFT_186211 [Stachybotrys elegans]|uniref:N-acetyltransferase ESCO zinc-finger domain-containing protein n=1 Tax=Stachybotrys elegans TaxID=80388 RepID=A0A8K0SW29_9HYPO|nr:hypothetical protein B0I35DRAFT_186211 [Stachybotrys elegans]